MSKKVILFLVMLFVFFGVIKANVLVNSVDSVYHDGKALVDTLYHDGKGAVSTLYSDMKSGISGLYPDIKTAIEAIGGAIGVAAEHVYGVLVKKYVVLGVKQLLVFILGFLSLLVGLCMWWKTTGIFTYRHIIPIVLILTGLVTVLLVNYDQMLMGLINPEYGALDYILEYTKSIFGK